MYSCEKEFILNGISCDASEFSSYLVNRKIDVRVTLFFNGGNSESYDWHVSMFTKNSSLSGNIHSHPRILRDWKKRGVIGAVFEI